MKKKKQILTLQSLRAFAIIMIFIEHTAVQNGLRFLYGGAEGVSFFFVLSGFVTALTCIDRAEHAGMKEIVDYVKKKLKKFYPLHIVMLLASMALTVCFILREGSEIFDQLLLIFGKAAVNAFLVQAFIPVRGWYMNPLNGVTWFLSATMFFYLITFPVLKQLRKIQNSRKKQILLLLLLILLQFLGVLCWNDAQMATYILYICPLFRSIDFICGIVLGILYMETQGEVERNAAQKRFFSGMECVVLLLWLCNHFFIQTSCVPGLSFMTRSTTLWCSLLLVLVFAYQKGGISKVLENKVTVWLGNRSFEIYIIHKVVIQYVTTVLGWTMGAAMVSAVIVLLAAYFVHDVIPKRQKNRNR